MKKLFFLILSPLMISTSFGICSKKIKLNSIDTSVYRCDDGTISYNQAYYSGLSSKKTDYNGLCGATAASNVIHAFCKGIFTEPTELGDTRFSDITPGIRPDTLESGLNSFFQDNKECPAGEWKYYYTDNRFDFLNSLKIETRKQNSGWTRIANGKSRKISPVIALVESFSTPGVLHYVTVVDVIGFDNNNYKESYNSKTCKVVFNHFGIQSIKTCKEFSIQSQKVNDSVWTSLYSDYIHFVFEK